MTDPTPPPAFAAVALAVEHDRPDPAAGLRRSRVGGGGMTGPTPPPAFAAVALAVAA